MTVRSTLTKGDQKDQIDKEFKQSVVKPILKFHFKRDEFLGRINEFVYFLPFSDSELRQLVEFQLKMWKRIALEKHSIQLDWTEERVRIFFGLASAIYGFFAVRGMQITSFWNRSKQIFKCYPFGPVDCLKMSKVTPPRMLLLF